MDKNTMYMVSVVIQNITAAEYAGQYDGNEETEVIMGEYEDVLIGGRFNVFNTQFSKTFNSLDDAKKEFKRHSSYHESENGDSQNIHETIDVISRDTEFKKEIMYCEDGHNIVITLCEVCED